MKSQELAKLQEWSNLNHNQVVNRIVKCWSIVAKCSQLAFKISLTNNDYIYLENWLKKERNVLIEVSSYMHLVVQVGEV